MWLVSFRVNVAPTELIQSARSIDISATPLGGASGSPRRHGNRAFAGPPLAMRSSSPLALPSAGFPLACICDLIFLLAAEDVLSLPMGVLLQRATPFLQF